jgi:hypothetical protein
MPLLCLVGDALLHAGAEDQRHWSVPQPQDPPLLGAGGAGRDSAWPDPPILRGDVKSLRVSLLRTSFLAGTFSMRPSFTQACRHDAAMSRSDFTNSARPVTGDDDTLAAARPDRLPDGDLQSLAVSASPRGAQSSAYRPNACPLRAISLSTSSSSTLARSGDSGPPCGVPSLRSCTTPLTMPLDSSFASSLFFAKMLPRIQAATAKRLG